MKYKIKTVARLTGFKADLLRSWERRHNLLRPERTEGGHRLYTDDDLAVLQEVRRLMSDGRSIGAIAQAGRDELLAAGRRRRNQGRETWGGPRPTVRHLAEEELQSRRADLIRAAVQVDQLRMIRSLQNLFEVGEFRQVVEQVLAPVSERIGELWKEGVCPVAGEHLAASAIRGRLLDILAREVGAQNSNKGPLVVIACFPGELHENAALFWALNQVWSGRRVVWLGADLPFDELQEACERLMPDQIHLSVTTREVYEAAKEGLEIFSGRWSPRVQVLVGGRGAEPALQSTMEAG